MFSPNELLQSKAWGTRDALLAETLRRRGHYQEAASTYERAAWRFSLHGGVVLLREADEGIAHYGAALCYLAMGNEGEALRALRASLRALERAYRMQTRVYDKVGKHAVLGLARTVADGFDEYTNEVKRDKEGVTLREGERRRPPQVFPRAS